MIRTQALIGVLILLISCSGGEQVKESIASEETAKPEEEKVQKPFILFFGNSITAGYQLDMSDAFPAIIQVWLDSLGYDYQVINAGLSGETTASGKSRIEWVLRSVPDIFVLELGANDGLRGLPLSTSKGNLQAIINAVVKVNPNAQIVIAGMEVPPNLGQDYTEQFRNLFPELAEKNNAVLIPFLLEGVAGNPELNLSDGIHPTPEGHEVLANTVWTYLQPLLEKQTL